jgi:hypothetical protein
MDYVPSRRNGENWRFFSSAQSAISPRFKHRARSKCLNLPCVTSVVSGWLVAPDRAPFLIGATPASCESRVATSALARGETDICLQVGRARQLVDSIDDHRAAGAQELFLAILIQFPARKRPAGGQAAEAIRQLTGHDESLRRHLAALAPVGPTQVSQPGTGAGRRPSTGRETRRLDRGKKWDKMGLFRGLHSHPPSLGAQLLRPRKGPWRQVLRTPK